MSDQSPIVPDFLDDPNVQAAYSESAAVFVQSLGLPDAVQRSVGPTPELTFDVWSPAKRVGFDVHDLSGGRPGIYERGFLRARLLAARSADARYVQFFSDEWRHKADICRSVVANAMGATPIKLNGRDCVTDVVSALQTKPFLNECHLQGATRASDHVLLKHPEHGIVGCVTVRTPIQKKYGHVAELARLAFRPGFSVRGGAGKVIDVALDLARKKGFDGMLSYSELRFGTGGVYLQCGFEQVGETTVNYFYTQGVTRYDRFKYRAQPGKSEKQVVDEAGVRPVWGAGHRVFLKKL